MNRAMGDFVYFIFSMRSLLIALTLGGSLWLFAQTEKKAQPAQQQSNRPTIERPVEKPRSAAEPAMPAQPANPHPHHPAAQPNKPAEPQKHTAKPAHDHAHPSAQPATPAQPPKPKAEPQKAAPNR